MSDDILEALGTARMKTHRHRWSNYSTLGQPGEAIVYWKQCDHCGLQQDGARSRRGKLARQRGNAYERELAHRLGLTRTGQYGGPEDVGIHSEWMVLQAKNGGVFPELIWRWLSALPHDDRLRAVVIGDAPGAGHRRREIIALDLQDFIDWFGGDLTSLLRSGDKLGG